MEEQHVSTESVVTEEVQKPEWLTKIEGTAGRTFADGDDFIKHYENLKNFVGGDTKKQAAVTKDIMKEYSISDPQIVKQAFQRSMSFFKDLGVTPDQVNPLEVKALLEAMTKKPVPPTRSASNNVDTKKVEELGRRVLSYNSRDDDKQALVAAVLGL